MRRRLILLPGALESEGQAPLFERSGDLLATMAQRGRVVRIQAGPGRAPELEWVGLDPAVHSAEEGPLFVAALGAKPPDRSVQFRLSLLSTDGSQVRQPGYIPDESESEVLWSQIRRLETARLKPVKGRDLEHGLVWEDGSIELGCRKPAEAEERGLRAALPEGDGEPMLRRLIDDSVNLLSELEMNAIRIEEGLPPLNLLWPWGPGFAPRLPNLTTERGASLRFESTSPRLAGLCQLCGYRHGDPWSLGRGTSLRLEAMAASAASEPIWAAAIPEPGEFRTKGREEEAVWLGAEIAERLIAPMLAADRSDPVRIVLIATDSHGAGLSLDYASDGLASEVPLPFRGEIAHESRLAARPLHEAVAEVLTP